MKNRINPFLRLAVFSPMLALVALSTAPAATIDTTATTISYTAPQDLQDIVFIGNGVLDFNGTGLIGLQNAPGGIPVEMAMTGGSITLQSGVTLQNGGYQGGVWTNNLASMDVAAGATLDVWDGNPVRVDSLTGAGTVSITDTFGFNWAGARSLVVGVNNGSGTFTGILNGNPFNGAGGTLSLTKEGSGTQTLAGTTTYNGGTTINGGRLVLVDTTTGSPNFTNNAELEFQITTGDQRLSNNGTISGSGNLIKTGAGTLFLGLWNGPQIISLTGAASVIDIQEGTVAQDWSNPDAWNSNQAGLNIASGAVFDIANGSASVDELTGAGTFGKNQGGAVTLTLGVNNGTGTFDGSIFNGAGGMALVKTGTGTQTLAGGCGHNGGTTVNGGRLILVNTGTGSPNFTTNATLELNITSGNYLAAGGTINGSGNLIKTGAGEFWLGGDNAPQTIALTGADSIIDVQEGLLRNEYGNSAWTGNQAGLNVAGGAIFDIWDGSATVDELTGSGIVNKAWSGDKTLTIGVNNGSGTFSGTIYNNNTFLGYGGSGGGDLSLLKQGTGTQTLEGNNTYIGATTVSAGILALVGGSQASPITVSAGASLGFTLGSPTTSSNYFDFAAGSTIAVTGTPVAASYTLITASIGIYGTPTLLTPIPGYDLVADVNDGSLKLVQIGGSGYSSWAATNAPTGSSADDFDGDGVSNGTEYVLGGTKLTNDLGKLPQVSSSGTNMVFSFNRDQASIDGTTTLTIEVGTTLATWPDNYVVPGTALANNPGVTVTKDTSVGFDTIVLTVPRAPNAQKFARLRVITN